MVRAPGEVGAKECYGGGFLHVKKTGYDSR